MVVKNVEKKEKSIVDITIELSTEEFDAEVEKAYRKSKNRISIPGFRKGKAPRKMVERMYGRMYFYEDAVEQCCPRFAAEAAEGEKLKAVGDYSYSNFDFPDEGGCVYTVSIPVYPEVELGEYKGVEAYKPPVTVEDEDIDRQLQSMRERNARQVPVEREVALDDIINLDFEGFCDGVAFSGGKAEKQNLTIGSGMFVPGFEEQLIGHKAGDEFTIDVKFPEDYGNEELAGKDTKFNIKIHEVKEKQLPELDNEFAKDVSEYDTLEELRESIKNNLTEAAQKESDNQFRSALLKKVASDMKADIPDAMFESRLDQIVERYAMDMQYQGMAFEQFLQYMNTTLEQFRERFRSSAEDQVKVDIALSKIADTEEIQPTDEEIDKEYADLAETYQMKEEEIKSRLPKETVIADLRLEKAAKIVVDNAVASEIKPEEPTPDTKAAENETKEQSAQTEDEKAE